MFSRSSGGDFELVSDHHAPQHELMENELYFDGVLPRYFVFHCFYLLLIYREMLIDIFSL